ncbi:hypothetical protein FH972_021975 [Carpinus fangiana]|uniref:Uncharacterized protein n=1 Tax=Carpinus fangiana TaxID=176857 RepID=A0A5N6KRG4_9ROSI|nr:hypothetical protein FH972_021975 [Carpinus fangiana]
MASPDPPVAIDGSCSVIHDNTLFVYSPKAFQSLPLSDGAKWSQLKNGTSVSGATCVKAGNDALWIVGGLSQDKDYAGLQKYSFSSKSWESIVPVVNITKGRQGHSATYLSASSMILVYAGSKVDPKQLSQETFAIETKKPYNVLAYSGKTPPVVQPILLPWDDSSVITLGGNADNKDIYLFKTSTNGWQKYKTALPRVPKGPDAERGTLVLGSDGSKVLELYDMSVSPNEVSRFVLQNAQGRPAQTGSTVGKPESRKRKRDLTLNSWPAYNDTAAPTYIRSGFDIAQSDTGLKKKAAQASQSDTEKPRLSFADRGAPYMMEGGNPTGIPGYDPHSSIAIIGGGMGNHKRGMESRGSESSTARLVPGKKSGLGMNDAMEMATIREKNDSPGTGYRPGNSGLMPPKRSSGWSRYFSGNTEILAGSRGSRTSSRKSDGLRKSAFSRKSTRSSVGSSHYAASHHDCQSHGPTEIPPLKFGEEFESTRVNSLVTSQNSATPAKHNYSRSRPDTMNSQLSSNPPSTLDDTIFTYEASPANENNRWTPVGSANNRSEWSKDWTGATGAAQRNTATSSIYGPPPRNGSRDPNASSVYAPQSKAMRDTHSRPLSSAPAMAAPPPAVPPPSTVYTTPSGGGGGFFTGPVGGAVYPSNRPPTTRTDTHEPFLDSRAQGPIYGNANQARAYDAPENAGTNFNNLSMPAPTASASLATQAQPEQPNPLTSQLKPTTYQSSGRKPVGNPFVASNGPAASTARGLGAAGDPPVQEVSKPAAIATPETRRDSIHNGWPTPPQRASIVDMDDLESSDDEEAEVVYATASSGAAPTAMTAIPVPGSTAMQYTVKKAPKDTGNTDMGWVDLRG